MRFVLSIILFWSGMDLYIYSEKFIFTDIYIKVSIPIFSSQFLYIEIVVNYRDHYNSIRVVVRDPLIIWVGVIS